VILGWWRRRRRRRWLERPTPSAWRPWLSALPFYERLSAEERTRLEATTRILAAEKTWEGCDGLVVTPEMKVVIAAQAALLVLEIEHDYYADVTSIVIFPTTYASPFERKDALGIASTGEQHLGEAWYRGPVVLAWDSALHGAHDPRDGHNLVWHEFAHRLDALDGFFDGTPPLDREADYEVWKQTFGGAYQRLRDDIEAGRPHVLDSYAATNEAEFFAVAVETFFERPRRLQREEPGLYDTLRAYFRQDPLARLNGS